MNDETRPNPPSLAELLYALIPALVLFLDSILAHPNQQQTPALRRLARTLGQLRALAAFFGIPFPAAPTPALRRLRTSRGATRPSRPTRVDQPHTPPALQIRRPSLAPEPWRTLEL